MLNFEDPLGVQVCSSRFPSEVEISGMSYYSLLTLWVLLNGVLILIVSTFQPSFPPYIDLLGLPSYSETSYDAWSEGLDMVEQVIDA